MPCGRFERAMRFSKVVPQILHEVEFLWQRHLVEWQNDSHGLTLSRTRREGENFGERVQQLETSRLRVIWSVCPLCTKC
jgi:hypothetical protein